jgi:N-acetylglucosaminyldiphosphoundecaprenol N-acetyl-beta-D-mannosaminyltransferase
VPPAPSGRFPVIGTWIHSTDSMRTVETIRGWIAAGRREYVCVTNVHSVMEAHRDPALRAIYNAAALAVPDGMPLVWAGRAMGHHDVRRVYGPDLMLALGEAASREGWSCYFYGGMPGVAEEVQRRLGARFPGLRAAGASAPPFRPLTPEETEAELAVIDGARADIVFVALGCPRQERWMAAHRPRLQAAVLIGVGAAFDFVAGRLRQAPRWMMRLGLEWLFRLLQEPGRLWYRYLVYNPLFVACLVLQAVGLRRYQPEEPPAAT